MHLSAKILITACVLTCTLAARQAAVSQDDRTRADAAFQKNDWKTAADGYRAIVGAEPANGMGWFRLGWSLDQIGGRDGDALDAYAHAIQLGFQAMRAEFGTARVLVHQNKTREALTHLQRAAALGAPPAGIESEPAFAALKTQPEYPAILAAAEAARFPCRAVHTFDFWVGDFDTKPWNQPDGPAGGQLHNTREYDGCVIVERFEAAGGAGGGMSMAFYDVSRKVWRMIWNDDTNSSNDFEGTYKDGAMRFEGWQLDPQGNRMLTSNVLQDVTPDLIRHIYSTSSDGGKTWVVRSDGRFVRRPHR